METATEASYVGCYRLRIADSSGAFREIEIPDGMRSNGACVYRVTYSHYCGTVNRVEILERRQPTQE